MAAVACSLSAATPLPKSFAAGDERVLSYRSSLSLRCTWLGACESVRTKARTMGADARKWTARKQQSRTKPALLSREPVLLLQRILRRVGSALCGSTGNFLGLVDCSILSLFNSALCRLGAFCGLGGVGRGSSRRSGRRSSRRSGRSGSRSSGRSGSRSWRSGWFGFFFLAASGDRNSKQRSNEQRFVHIGGSLCRH